MTDNISGTWTRAGLLVSVSIGALLVSTPAQAQTTPTTPVNPETVTDQTIQNPNAPTAQDQNTIVVTGTRIKQPEFTSPDPVSRIDPALAKNEGKLELASTLQSSPIAAGSTQITQALSANFVTNGGPGSQTIDLRGLGANRTLVLLNGRRAGPAGTRGGVSSFDLNVLPQSIVKNVDILKTGASSIYGSDAVAGVVNLITKTDFDGIQLDGFASVPTHAGGEQFSTSVLWGKKFDRGHVMVALDYFKQNELARGDRKYLACPEAFIFQPGSNQRADLIDPRTGKFHCEDLPVGQVWTYDFEYNYLYAPGNMFLPNGVYTGNVNLIQYQYPGETLGVPPAIFAPGTFSTLVVPPGWFPTGYDPASQAIQNDYNPFANEATIIPATKRYTLYADASYELTDGIEAYGEFLANRRKTYVNGFRQFWTFGYTASGGYCAYFDCFGSGPIPGYGASYWATGWTGLNLLSPTAVTDRGSDSKQKVDYWRGVGGFRGDFGNFLKGWSYDAYVQYSHNKGLYSNEQILQDAIDASYFQTASCVGQTLPVSGKQCMDLPWLDPYFLFGQFTPEQADYLFDWETGKTIYKQLSGEASITGTLFDLPAGPLGVALGVTARRDEIVDTPGAITLAANAWGSSSGGITAGHSVTTEAFGEVQIPLLKDKPFFRDLSFSGAARITNVKSVRASDGFTDEDKGNWTYKVGGNWAVSSWLRFRGTYGTSFRAPALFEQFKADETSFPSARAIDPCVNYGVNFANGNISQQVRDNCALNIPFNGGFIPPTYGGGSISATAHSSGGIGVLDPETSKALTGSVILTPRFAFLPDTRFSLAVDYYDIKVKGEVTQLGPVNIVLGCYESADFPNDPLCGLLQRGTFGTDPHAITEVSDPYINIAAQETKGLDFTALIQHDLGGLGTLTFLGQATRTLKDEFALFATTGESLLGVIDADRGSRTGSRKWVADLNLTWKLRNDWSLFWGTEIYGKASNNKEFSESHKIAGVPSLCPTSVLYGNFCVDVSVPTYWYHSASISKQIGSPNHRLELTLGMRNIFDKKPPQVSLIGGTGLPVTIGPVVATSQYDFLGRRVFFNLTKKF
jgi:iron complex outermembrane receptor protein